jgi:hypothetical protein
VERLDGTATRAMRLLLDEQPLTEAKVRFAWTMAVGPALARAATVSFADGTLRVRAKSAAWRDELRRATPLTRHRLAQFLGDDAVRTIVIDSDDAR